MKQKQGTKYYLAGFVSLITFAAYLTSIQNEFVQWDDGHYVFENPHIRLLNTAFFKWAFFDFHAGNWHPLTWISHALDYAVWGLNPMGHHLGNVILHAVNTFVVVFLIIRLLDAVRQRTIQGGQPSFLNDRTMLIAAGVTGLLFGIHPVHVESVAWVSERKDLLCALFFMLSIMAYMKYAGKTAAVTQTKKTNPPILPFLKGGEGGLKRQYLMSLGFFILALMSKPMAISLPVVLLVLDWHPFKRIQSFKALRTAIVEKLPFIALSVGSIILTFFAQRSGGAIRSMEYASLSTRILVGMRSLVAYLWKMILPLNLIPFYPYPKDASLFSLEYLSAVILVGGITAACIVLAKRQKLWLSVWGYYVITLLPVLGIVQVGLQSMADRYTYLPGLGPFLLIGIMTAWIWARIQRPDKQGLIARSLTVAAALLVFISLSYLTFKQIGIWKNSIVLWSYVIEKEPERVPFAYINRGIAFEKTGQMKEAIEDYNRVIALDPLYFEAYNNLGVLYGQNELFDKAIEYFNKSVGIDPTYVDAYVNRGIAYALSGRYDSALEDFNKAVLLDQNSAEAYFNRGNLYLSIGRKDLAVSDFRKACDLGKQDACTRSALY
jgi:Tfp pilus assembly protein PilF